MLKYCKQLLALALIMQLTLVPNISAQSTTTPSLSVNYYCRSYSALVCNALNCSYPSISGSISVPMNSSRHFVFNGALPGKAGDFSYSLNLDYTKTNASTLVCRAGVASSNAANHTVVYSQAGATDSRGACALTLPGTIPLNVTFNNGSTSNIGMCRLTFR